MNPQDAMLLFITASQDYLVIHFVYLQLSCTTSNFGSLTRGNPHSPYFNHILLSVPTRRISAIPRVYLDIQLRFTWPGYNPGVIVVGKEGKNLDLEALDPCKAHFLMRMIPLKKNLQTVWRCYVRHHYNLWSLLWYLHGSPLD